MKLFNKIKFRKNNKKKIIENQDEDTLDILNKDPESLFEKNRRTLKDMIATDFDFSDPKKAIIGDNLHAKNMYIAFTPDEINFASTFHPLYNFGDIDVSIFIDPIDNEEAVAELSKLRTNLETEYYGADGSNNRMDDMSEKAGDAARFRSEIKNSLNRAYDVGILATLYAKSERDLNNGADRLREQLGQADVGIRNGAWFQEDIFFSNLPLGEDRFKVKHSFDKRSLASLFPFTTNNINHKNGTMIAINMDNNNPIFWDNFDPSLANYNIFCFAQSGSGKSSFIKTLGARTSTLDSIQNIALDIEGEYRNIAETLGGTNITLDPVGTTVINFFDVTIDIEEDKITGRLIEDIKLTEKINNVTSLLMVLAKGFVGNNKYYDDITRTIIRRCVIEVYKPMNLTTEPESLFEYVDNGITLSRVKKIPPTLSDWYKKLEEMAETERSNINRSPYYDYLLDVMSNFVRSKDGGLLCFDGQTTSDVQLGYDIPFINIDLSKLHETTELPLAQYIMCDFIWEQVIKRNEVRKGEKPHKIRLIVDEAWRMVDYDEAIEFLTKMARRGRKKNASACIITQQFDEFYSEKTSAIVKQSYTKFFLRPDSTEVDSIKEVFKLTDGEADFLKSCNVGEVLMKQGSVSVKAKVLIPNFEMSFINTNQNKKVV